MSAAPALPIARQAGIGFAINATLSLAFFLGIFGMVARPLTWGAPDALGLDFVPQSIAVALMSALVPSLIARTRLGRRVSTRTIILRAFGFAIGGAVLGGLLAWATGAVAQSPVAWGQALAIKLLYGGSLGALITILALKRMTR
ncbi:MULTISPECIES: hypothetical protein [Sphingobium]|uniref:Uncharacterized protein n=2 Tax=Sphingobium cupriresistens TaxID=1132417 RepID=A0A0J8ALZ6_9SPHN|nr:MULTISPECIES: hypothetical protein [Sphingobium]KMS55595.1 hypothetical protein V473_12695 [Sphingobium cupriresistens LL01]MBJ7377668.1 hypothetical protein [Sphingobium sp.]RYM08767.1 hypothetical protein EWH12_15955 [Sphingobium cupriresistens]WCP12562.1 hypothetical protein sphantq_00962 [Sphingobium sp. AntQ-1]